MKLSSKNKYRLSTEESGEQPQQATQAIQLVMPKLSEELSGMNGVEVESNKIYFYCDVDEEKVLALNKALNKVDTELQILAINLGVPDIKFPIDLHIHSPGGSIFAGFAAYDYIRRCKNPVHTYVDGMAASAASLMSMAGEKRFISPNSFILIHQLSSGLFGTHENFKDTIVNQNKLMDTMFNIYKKHSKMNEKKIKSILKHDFWLDSEKCLEYGLVDQIV
jgi:ATP-dependent Clp endopeptidase proteolytic subunit ClpP